MKSWSFVNTAMFDTSAWETVMKFYTDAVLLSLYIQIKALLSVKKSPLLCVTLIKENR